MLKCSISRDPLKCLASQALVPNRHRQIPIGFLALAAEQGITVDAYEDEADGALLRLADGRRVLGNNCLRPKVTLGLVRLSRAG